MIKWSDVPLVARYLITLCEALFACASPLGNISRLEYRVLAKSDRGMQVAPVLRCASCMFCVSPPRRSIVVAKR